MIRLVLLWLTLFTSICFLLIPNTGTMGFLFSTQRLTPHTWFYFLFEHLILVILAVVILSYEKKYRTTTIVFLCIQVADCVDYCLTYAEPWTNSPITFNTLKVLVFSVSIAYDFIKHGKDSRTANQN